MLSDVVESDELMNPKSVICSEPLIVPAGVLSPLSETNPNAVICADELINELPVNAFIEAVALAKSSTLVSNEDEVNSILSNLWSVDDVYVLNPSNLVSVDDV